MPSEVVEKLYSSGRTAIIRGSGSISASDTNAAVCILESYTKNSDVPIGSTMGLVRLIQIKEDSCYMDISLSGLSSGIYTLNPHINGDLSNVPASNGPVFEINESEAAKTASKTVIINVDSTGNGKTWADCAGWRIYELIGRSILVTKQQQSTTSSAASASTDNDIRSYTNSPILSGIVARSAGLFENKKVICACTGRTLWEEDKFIRQKV
ncbi:Superoxide dismutase 1 copper chaperone [Smittium culicis]|uniref:Superoxide dismutase 1 copper chaperone n=1 Tax=Smittium culicis TaxID=133412 RepID=A0A1R1X373_9FUNG|nr:Superoxide dismutase 1 copper chaperone [Smittium culicis]OMJ14658.1 Superoxide dismutase 1 copper chaperone [Smittium culicis]